MATRPKAIIESRNGEKFSPITIAKNVLTNNGQNLHDILSDRKEDMMTPTIENSSSMFKVGQGDNVDYSSNVVSGAYESMVLKGKTMVNCIQESSSQDVVLPYEFEEGRYMTINDTKESGALGVELKGQTLVNLIEVSTKTPLFVQLHSNGHCFLGKCDKIKPSTTYTVFYTVTEQTSTANKPCFNLSSGGGKPDITIEPTKDRVVFTTPSDYSGAGKTMRLYYFSNDTCKISHMVLLEGDYTDVDIPYFEGMTSCKMPILCTVGKNLFDGEIELGTINVNSGEATSTTTEIRSKNFTPINGTPFVFSRTDSTGSLAMRYYDINKNYLGTGDGGMGTGQTSRICTPPTNARYVKFKDMTVNLSQKVQIEYNTSATTYEEHKSSILSLPEEVVLRKIRNVYETIEDTLSCSTGTMKSYVNELTLNGSEDWNLYRDRESNTIAFMFHAPHGRMRQIGVMSCDKVPVYTQNEALKLEDKEWCFYNDHGSPIVFINVLRSKLTSPDVAGFKTWLRENNVKIQYPRETPIVTKINLPSTLKSWNTTTHIYSEIPENTLYPILSHSNPTYPVILKPSTKYSIVANSYSNNHTNSAINFNLGGATTSTTVGNRVTTITTPSTLTSEELIMSGRGNRLNNVMVIEGDVVGDEPYFEGICDVKSPILSNVGKNLLPTELSRSFKHITGNQVVSSIDLTSFLNRGVQYVIKLAIPKNVKIAKHYSSNSADTESVLVSHGAINSNNTIARFTIPSNSNSYYLFVNESGQSSSDYISDISELVTIELDTGNIPTEIKPYKSNITTFDQKDDKTIVLRSLPNGVCDTLNVETGEYVQRIGDCVLNGTESWVLDGYTTNANLSNENLCFYTRTIKNVVTSGAYWNSAGGCISNRLPSYGYDHLTGKNGNPEGISAVDGRIGISVNKALLETYDEAGVKRWLAQNPIAVQYELATPIVSTVDIQGFPYAYTNGHVQLSSGHSGQSLTPKVEYSVVTNRNGQIRSNQKMVERHQKQLDRLQAMILTNLINTQYEQTLTNLKYDLKNVREEVK